jgi:hypothetical protein
MLKKIDQILIDHYGILTDQGSEDILDLLEEVGMLPPPTDWLVKNRPQEMTWSEVHDYHIWEPEEE